MGIINSNYEHQIVEPKWREHWERIKLYAWNKDATRENSFVIDTPPPYASGTLHMGHVFGFIQTDSIARYQRMKGKNVFYPIGFDDNGLPTERVVEKQTGRKASSMPRHEFRELCNNVIDEIEAGFTESFKLTSLSLDWDQFYRTIDDRSVTISQMSFLDLYEKDLVYRTLQPTIWDPVDNTALAQADLEDKEKAGVMYEIKFHTEAKEEIVIASTRPELLPACVAIFYNKDDTRYKHLHGQFAIVPICGTKVPILADDQVQIDKGTGLVMCCTFGDMVDIEWWRKHKLPTRVILDQFGRIALKDKLKDQAFQFQETHLFLELVEKLEQKKVSEAREIMVEGLRNHGAILSQTEVMRMVKCAERSKAPMEILVTPQWAIKVLDKKEELIAKAKECQWHPEHMLHRMINWIQGVSWDWCISRQRYFGVPFPIWYSKRKGEEGKILVASKDQLPVDPTVDLPAGYTKDEVTPELDVMDTWATSSVTPQINSMGINDKFYMDAERHKKLFPADLRPQGHEIIRTWAFYTLVKSLMHENTIPWKNVMVNGWVLTADKAKMSKSKGNVISPVQLMAEHGTDVVRYWASAFAPGTDIIFSEDAFKNGKRLVNKLWNAAKFVSSHMGAMNITAPSILKVNCDIDRWIISRLHEVVQAATKAFDGFEYFASRSKVEAFFWRDFCDNYLELIKTRIYDAENKNPIGQASAVHTCALVLSTLLKLLAPFMPHITEEIYSLVFESPSSIHAQGTWPRFQEIPYDKKSLIAGGFIEQLLAAVRKFKTEEKASMKTEIAAIDIIPMNDKIIAADFGDSLQDLKDATNTKALSFNENPGKNAYKKYLTDDENFSVVIYQ
jgi:valyl-tRNA synthetase